MTGAQTFQLGDFVLQSGETLHNAKLAYKTYGNLNAAKDNVIVYLTRFGGTHVENEAFIGNDMALDPERYFIIVPNMFGNGASSSPSNTPPPFDRSNFPGTTIHDNVYAQHRLVTEVLGIERVKLVVGWSMGGLQTFEWAALYPEMVERMAPLCGAARCSRHNYVFLEGMKAALTTDQNWQAGRYDEPPTAGLRAIGRAWASWALSQAFYNKELYQKLGHATVDDYLRDYWEAMFLDRDANNMLSMIWTWQRADISVNDIYNGSFENALGAITAKSFVMPGETDLYFQAADSAYEVDHMPNAELRPIPSLYGHLAAGNKDPADTKFINKNLKELLAS